MFTRFERKRNRIHLTVLDCWEKLSLFSIMATLQTFILSLLTLEAALLVHGEIGKFIFFFSQGMYLVMS